MDAKIETEHVRLSENWSDFELSTFGVCCTGLPKNL